MTCTYCGPAYGLEPGMVPNMAIEAMPRGQPSRAKQLPGYTLCGCKAGKELLEAAKLYNYMKSENK